MVALGVPTEREGHARARQRRASLSTRLLGLTILFVLLAEALIFAPSMAGFHREWLEDRHEEAELAAIAIAASNNGLIDASAATARLQTSRITAVIVRRNGEPELIFGAAPPAGARLAMVDLRSDRLGGSIRAAFASLFAPGDELVRIVGAPNVKDAKVVEVFTTQGAVRAAIWRWAAGVFALSLLVAGFAGALVYAAIATAFVRPIQSLTRAMIAFRDAPLDATRAIRPTNRDDEIGDAEEALADMEAQVRASLAQRERLAALGSAVSRISHDLRNSLAAASLVSERLSSSEDPAVRAALPRLERAIERAAGLAENTLRFGKAQERAPEAVPIPLNEALLDAAEEAFAAHPGAVLRSHVEPGLTVSADGEHLHRILSNLLRNAASASARIGRPDAAIDVSASSDGARVFIRLQDQAGGVPERVLARLFEPFSSGDRAAGTGLGLAISRELARLNGGDVRLARTGAEGSVFEVVLKAAS